MPKRVKTKTGVLVTIPDDFFDPKTHLEVDEEGESPLMPDGTFRPPTYPSKSSAKKAASKQAGTGHKANTEES
jgi:hypothetical protein